MPALAAALVLLSESAFRQALSELRQTEPGSLLFGVLQLVIGTSAGMAAIGLVKRARWAAGAVAMWGLATVALLAVQPLFTPMESSVQWSIWLAAAALRVGAAGVSWFARGLARADIASRIGAARVSTVPPVPVPLAEVPQPGESSIVRGPDAIVSRGRQRNDEQPSPPAIPIHE